MKDSLLNEALDHYKKVISTYETTGYSKSYTLNVFWSDANMKEMLEILNGASSAIEAIHSVQKTFMFSVNTSDSVKEKAVDWLLAEQKSRGIDIFDMSDAIQGSRFSNPQNNVLRKKRILTPDFLRTVNILHEIKKHCKIVEAKLHIVELGGGCGHLARTIRLFLPTCSYVIIDIPESLSFSYMFLKQNFPTIRSLYITDEDQLNECPIDKFDYLFIPTKFAQGILENEFDLFINTASLGEMKNDTIRYWMDFIQNKLKVKYIFTLNRYLNTIKTDGSMDWRLDENECSVLYDSDWNILKWELEPSFTRCPYVDTIIARYLEIVAERIPPLSIAEGQEISQQLMLEVMQEDWVRLEKSFSSEMTYRDNILVNNMTMSGTLFKLWESIRLYPNSMSVGLMLKYIETLIHRHDREFEETYYYENLFDTLFIDKENKSLLDIHNVIKQKREYRKSFPELPPSLTYRFCLANVYLGFIEYEGFNIVKFGDNFYALNQNLGPVDFNNANIQNLLQEYCDKSLCFMGNSIPEVKHLIAKSYNNTLQVSLSDKDKTIEAFMKDISYRDDNIIKLNEDISGCRRDIQTLREDIISKENNMAVLKGDILKRDEDIKGLKQELSFIKSKWWFKLFKGRYNKNMKENL